ncbi:MAG: hypothetical protein ACR2MD_19350 [Aridibacter sp.]
MKHKFSVLLFFLTFLFVISAINVNACSCGRNPVCEMNLYHFDSDENVTFTGKVTEIEMVEQEYVRKDKTTYKAKIYRIKFDIKEVLGGKLKKNEKYVYTSNTTCRYDFKLNTEYLVYASRRNQENKLKTGHCSRTKELKLAQKEIQLIKKFKENGEIQRRLYGKVSVNLYVNQELGSQDVVEEKNLSFRIWAKRQEDGALFETLTNRKGFYDLMNLPDGEYEIFALNDKIEKKGLFEPKITDKSKCWEMNFFFYDDDLKKLGLRN